jgi:hypothetical protein
MTIRRQARPEEEELEVKKTELAVLEEELALKELDLETLRSEIRTFLRVYLASVGPIALERDRLFARIANSIYALDPTEINRKRSLAANETAGEAERDQNQQDSARGRHGPSESPRFESTAALRDRFIDLVKQAHPDLARDEEDRSKRNEFMVRVNHAYQEGNEEALRALGDEWALGGDRSQDESIGNHLVRLIRLIAAVKRRLIDAESEINGLKLSEDNILMERSFAASAEGRDLISQVVARIEEEIQELQTTIKESLARLETAAHP